MKLAVLLSFAVLVPSLLPAQNILSRMTPRTFKGKSGTMPYRIFVPANIEGEVPLILFLHDSWTATYANPEVLKWMFAQKR